MLNGTKIRSLRRDKRWTLEQMARVAGIGFTHLSEIETSTRSNVTLDTAIKIADALGVRVDTIRAKGIAPDEKKDQPKPIKPAPVQSVPSGIRTALHGIDSARDHLSKSKRSKSAAR